MHSPVRVIQTPTHTITIQLLCTLTINLVPSGAGFVWASCEDPTYLLTFKEHADE